MEKIYDFAKRHLTTLILMIVALIIINYMVKSFDPVLKTIILITGLECLALLLSGFALFVYTKIDFTQKLLDYDKNYKMNSVEVNAFARVIASVFLGVHILVGLVVFGIYLGSFLN